MKNRSEALKASERFWTFRKVLRLQFCKSGAEVGEADFEVGDGVFGVFLVFEGEDVLVVLGFEGFEAAENVEVPFPEDFEDVGVFDILEVATVDTALEAFDGLDGVLAAAEVVAGIDAGTDANVVILDGIDDVVDFVVIGLGAVIVNGDVDLVFLDELIEEFEGFLGLLGVGAEGFDADGLGVIEILTGLGFIFIEAEDAVSEELDAVGFEEFLLFGDFAGDGGDGEVILEGLPIEELEFLHSSMALSSLKPRME